MIQLWKTAKQLRRNDSSSPYLDMTLTILKSFNNFGNIHKNAQKTITHHVFLMNLEKNCRCGKDNDRDMFVI